MSTSTAVVEVFPKVRRRLWLREALRREIMLGIIEPGAQIVELELAARFQCSQSTVRESLMLLQEEGLVQRSGHRGTRVSEVHEDEAMEMLRLRRDIECRGARRLFRTRDAGTLASALRETFEAMRNAAEADDEYRLVEADCEFHRRLFAEARLPNIEPLLLRCLTHNHRYKIRFAREPKDLPRTAARHAIIVEAVERRDTDALVEALSHHATTILDKGPRLVDPDEGPAAATKARTTRKKR